MNYPFQQEIIDNKIRRKFSPETDSDELKWHQDLKDRKVTILKDGGWQFQMEDCCQTNYRLPNKFLFRNLFGTGL